MKLLVVDVVQPSLDVVHQLVRDITFVVTAVVVAFADVVVVANVIVNGVVL